MKKNNELTGNSNEYYLGDSVVTHTASSPDAIRGRKERRRAVTGMSL